MALPKLDTPLHKGKLASSGKEVTFRPFKVKEEKILMLAAEGGEYEEMVNACAQIVGNCCEDVDAYTMPLFDLQDLFLQIRVQSHGAQADFRLFCGNEDCNEIVNYTMDLSEFKVEHVRHIKGITLSGGERRRVEIARALAMDPKFILLDEPFAGIDPIAVIDIQKIIKQLASNGIGILITDHSVRETLGICDQAYIVNQGEIFAQGTPKVIAQNQSVKDIYLGENFIL